MGNQRQKFHLRSALFPAGYYASNSVYQGYISLYYTQLGFSSGQLGLISAATAAAALAAQPLWGMVGDRVRRQRMLLGLLCLLSAVSLPLAVLRGNFAMQLGAAALFYAFFSALLPLGDAILLEAEKGGFGMYRLAGGASFALAGAVFGAVRARLGAGGAVWTAAALLGLTAISTFFLPETAGRQSQRHTSLFALLKNRRLLGMLAFLLPLQMSMGYFYTFYPPHFRSLAQGSDFLLGAGYFLSAVSEAPYLIFSGRIYRRFGAARPMCLAAAVMSLRWLLLGVSANAWWALVSQTLHGGGFIVITVSMAYWIGDHAPRELRASGQALLNMVSFGIARIAGNLGGGMLAQHLGRETTFLIGAGICAAALCIFAPWGLRGKE